MMPIGTFSQKMASQFQPSMTAPPTSGPTATPRPATPPQMPMAAGRRRAGTEPASRVSESGMMPAAPKPCTARAAMSCHGSVLRAANTLAMVKITMPATKTVRRPMRSPRAAAARMKVAKARVKAFTNHCSSSMEAPRSRRMAGRAFVITRLSSVAMNMGRLAATMASQVGTRRAVADSDDIGSGPSWS